MIINKLNNWRFNFLNTDIIVKLIRIIITYLITKLITKSVINFSLISSKLINLADISPVGNLIKNLAKRNPNYKCKNWRINLVKFVNLRIKFKCFWNNRWSLIDW